MISECRMHEILTAFGANPGRENPEQIATYSLTELLDVEAKLGDWNRNARYRVALRERIAELERRSKVSQDDHLSIGVKADDIPIWVKVIGYIIATSVVMGILKQVGSNLLNLF